MRSDTFLPASAESIEQQRHDPRWHEAGSGAFSLTTRALISHDGAIDEFRCVHRFWTATARDEYRAIAMQSGLSIVEVTDGNA